MRIRGTDWDVGTLVRVTSVAEGGDTRLLGVVGSLTHPFQPSQVEKHVHGKIGLFVPMGECLRAGLDWGILGVGVANLGPGDLVEILEPAVTPEPPLVATGCRV